MSLIGKKLVIISHTLHSNTSCNELVGWGPTVNEINFLSQYWEEVIHVACLNEGKADGSLLPYTSENIKFHAIPTFGGKSLKEKLTVFTRSIAILKIILASVNEASHVQIRVPMGIGIYVLPFFLFVPRKFILWVKYANNWQHFSSSFGYRYQRWFLKRNYLNCSVTINGIWPQQQRHLKSFENPCIRTDQIVKGSSINKEFNGPFKLVFAGRLESAKGIDLLIEILDKIPKNKIKEWVFLGDGPMKNTLIMKFKQHGINARFLGFVSQNNVHKELKNAHFLVLPSKSEGFPKVVAESWNYGCIPICSAVGSIPHYLINGENGFLLPNLSKEGLCKVLSDVLIMKSEDVLARISIKGKEMATIFTFDYYLEQLKNKVFNDN
jgi:glycosyltransferase involved in cell wall biosynthesis